MKRDVETRGLGREQDREEREGCRLVTLARNNVAHVQRCTHCGAIAVHLGPVTLRFDQGALESVWSLLGQALAQTTDDTEPRVVPQRFVRTGLA